MCILADKVVSIIDERLLTAREGVDDLVAAILAVIEIVGALEERCADVADVVDTVEDLLLHGVDALPVGLLCCRRGGK